MIVISEESRTQIENVQRAAKLFTDSAVHEAFMLGYNQAVKEFQERTRPAETVKDDG